METEIKRVFPVCTGLNRKNKNHKTHGSRVPRMHGAKPPSASAVSVYLRVPRTHGAKPDLSEVHQSNLACSPYARG